MKLEDQLALLNPQPGEWFSANYRREGMAKPKSVVLTAPHIPEYVDKLPLDADIWIGVNPVDLSKVVPGGRGTSRDVTRLTSLYADLDVKPGGCRDYSHAMEIVCTLADILGEEPTMIIHSGNGIQPYWAVDPDDNRPNPELAAILTRWGALVRIVAKSLGANVDSVFDLARILRAVGTLNNKRLHIDGFAVEVTGDQMTGGTMTLGQIVERLDEYGVPAVSAGSEDDFSGESDPAAWGFAPATCMYAKRAIDGWRTDPPGEKGRHPWFYGNCVRLQAFRRNGCLTGDDYRSAATNLKARFAEMCVQGIGGDSRRVRNDEGDSDLKDAQNYVALMSDARLIQEVNHLHDMAGPTANSDAAQGQPGGNTPRPESGVEDEHRELPPEQVWLSIFDAEGPNFWNSTDALKMIYETAMAFMVSPWAVLAHSVARVLQLVPPSVELPGYFGRGSLNWFGIVVDKSSGGKTAAARVAKSIVVLPHPQEINEEPVGSGEGMIDRYWEPDPNDPKLKIRREAVLFTCDEIDDLTAQGSRQGSTTFSMIRQGFSGSTLGHSYIAKGRNGKVEEGSYRMTFMLNAQPDRCGGLLADSAGGTPQRFMWFPANDPRITRAQANWRHVPPGVNLPSGLALLGRKLIQVPAEAEEITYQIREANGQGKESDLDGHANFARLKFAAGLALLDGRTDLGDEDWRLSGIALEVSNRTRDWVQAMLTHAQENEARETGRIRGISFAAADESKSTEVAKKIRRVQNGILKRLKEKGPQTAGELRTGTPHRDRSLFQGAFDGLEADGLIVLDADGKRWATA